MNSEIQVHDETAGIGTWSGDGGYPKSTVDPADGRSGLGLLQSMCEGEISPPPIMTLLGIKLVSIEHGDVTLHREPRDHFDDPMGPVLGGVVAALFDAALGSAIQSTLPAGRTYTTLDTKVSYLQPVASASGSLTVVARTIDVGEQRAVAEAYLTDADGQRCATAIMTCLLVAMSTKAAPGKTSLTWDESDWFKVS